jgi:hypothetical protein
MLNNEEDQKLIDGKSFGEAEELKTDGNSLHIKNSLGDLAEERLNKSDSKDNNRQ